MKKLFLLFLLAGCGFQPVFQGGDTDIYVAPISGINGIDLRNALSAKFGGMRDANAKYHLTVTLNAPITQYKALETTGDATWQEIKLSANYVLTADGQQIASGAASASESYTFVRYLVAANASYNNAVQNTIKVLSEKIGVRAIAEARRHDNMDAPVK